MKRCMTMALLAVVVPAAVAKAEEPYSSVSVFGDSLSDRGRIPGLIAEQNPAFPLRFPVSPPYSCFTTSQTGRETRRIFTFC